MKTVHISSTAAVVLLISYCAFAQAAFDMLSVEPNVSGGARGAVQMRSDGISGRNVTLKQLLRYAYEFQEPQISGPEWIEKDGFDIIVKSQDRVGTEQLRLTLQKLLADRFKLSSHRETRYIPGYRLVVAKTGAKLRDSKEEEIFNAALSGRPPFKEGFAAIFTNKDLPGFQRGYQEESAGLLPMARESKVAIGFNWSGVLIAAGPGWMAPHCTRPYRSSSVWSCLRKTCRLRSWSLIR